jgi:hypothetical protein
LTRLIYWQRCPHRAPKKPSNGYTSKDGALEAEAAADRTTADADIFALSGALCKSYGMHECMTALSPFEDIKNRINE